MAGRQVDDDSTIRQNDSTVNFRSVSW